MSIESEVAIAFGEVPTVRTGSELAVAAGQLLTSHYACVLALDEACLEAVDSRYAATDPVYRALRQALEIASPDLMWRRGETHDLGGNPDEEFGLHVDPMLPKMNAVGCHETEPGYGGLEATFASPTAGFDNDEHSDGLTDLLRRGKTDRRLADPASFRRVSLSDGGIIAFSFIYPDALPQLHDFHTTRGSRRSTSKVLEGY